LTIAARNPKPRAVLWSNRQLRRIALRFRRTRMSQDDSKHTKLPEATIVTTQPIGKSTTPRQPNEHDASPDSQASAPRADMQQAAADVASGQVDTDLRDQPTKNPANNGPATPSSKSTTLLPDGSRK
jgi:hypothetical protein